jgi:1,2-dihydroxy-3-keto-5-methylthiopentene dioxygenase
MSVLQIFDAPNAVLESNDPPAPITIRFETRNPAEITAQLSAIGVGFSRWQAAFELAPGADSEQVLAAYAHDIAKLKASGGYAAVDVVSLYPEHPERVALRQKFLSEHTHAEDEIRFFVAGSGHFYIHAKNAVYAVECQKNDLIHLPAGTKHWFDMGVAPFFVAIRVFTNPSGWVAQFTGSGVAERFVSV